MEGDYMGKREYFPAFFSYKRTLQALTDEQMGRVFRAALEYAENGTEPELEPIEMMGFAFMREDIDRANASYEELCAKQKANGSKGGRPAITKPNGFSENPKNPVVISETQKTYSEGEGKGKGESKGEGKEEDTEEEAAQVPYKDIRDLYHRLCPSYPELKAMSGKRKEAVSGRWHEHPDMEAFAEVFRNAEASDFMKGKNDRGWKASFDWMMAPSNFQKVWEGNYRNQTPVEDRDPMLAYLDSIIYGTEGSESNDQGRDCSDNQGASDSLSDFLLKVQTG